MDNRRRRPVCHRPKRPAYSDPNHLLSIHLLWECNRAIYCSGDIGICQLKWKTSRGKLPGGFLDIIHMLIVTPQKNGLVNSKNLTELGRLLGLIEHVSLLNRLQKTVNRTIELQR